MRMNILAYVHMRNIYRSTGAGRVARQMTEHLACRPGLNVHILADPRDHNRTVQHVGAPWSRFDYHFFKKETSQQQAGWLVAGTPTAEHYWPEADLVYCTAESYVPVRRARLAVTVHDAAIFEDHAHKQSFSLWKQRMKWRFLYSQLSRKADILHTVSQFSAERIGHYFPSVRSRLRVVHNGVSERFFAPSCDVGDRILQKLDLVQHPFIFLPGGLHHRKNASLVLKAWPMLVSQFPDLKLVIANHCEPAYLAAANALGNSVVMAGFVDDDELRSLYGAAQVAWFPSLYEGFGLPILEAMASGTPVVTSDCASMPEVAGGAAILAPPSDPSSHVEGIAALLTGSSLSNKLREQGKVRAADFTWTRSAAQLSQCFHSVM